MKTMEKNGRKFKNMYGLLQKAGQGVKMATDASYKTGYFMAKHPGVEYTKDQIQKNYKSGLIILIGVGLSLFGLARILAGMKK